MGSRLCSTAAGLKPNRDDFGGSAVSRVADAGGGPEGWRTESIGKVVAGITISVDGFTTGPGAGRQAVDELTINIAR